MGRIDNLEAAIQPVEVVLKRTGKEFMMIQYGLSDFESTQEFLCILAKRSGKMKKGAIPDVLAAAKKILHDWNMVVSNTSPAHQKRSRRPFTWAPPLSATWPRNFHWTMSTFRRRNRTTSTHCPSSSHRQRWP